MKTALENYFDRLWPITRSLTGDGNRLTLKILSEIIDLVLTEVPSGTPCLDWTVPPEWNIREAWIKDSRGRKIIDMADNNLHVLGYSVPFKGVLSYTALKSHLYSLPDQPELIPYLTSYYQKRWGFCLSHQQFLELDKNETYEIYIDSSLDEKGRMTVGEAVIEGQTEDEILLSTYICHPSMANNELSGPLVTAFLYRELKKKKDLRYTYRFLFAPETIGSLYHLSRKGPHWKTHLKAGFVVTCVGDSADFTYKKSRQGCSLADRAVETVLKQTEVHYRLLDFTPRGSDERQYCSPGFNLPVGSLMRSKHGDYPEYHTSGDNKDFIDFAAMEATIQKYYEILMAIEKNRIFVNTLPYGEPQLGRRGLYPTLSEKNKSRFIDAMMWILNLADGQHDVLSISRKSKIPLTDLYPVLKRLTEKGILTQ